MPNRKPSRTWIWRLAFKPDLPRDALSVQHSRFCGGYSHRDYGSGTAEQYSASVLKVDPSNGEVLDTLGVSALTNTTPRDLALDENGNIYVLVNSSPGDVAVYMLDSHGNLLKRFGKLIYQPPEGERQETDTLFDPISLAVSPDGRFLIICDAVQDRTYLTAFNIKD